MRKFILLLLAFANFLLASSQTTSADSPTNSKKDSTLRATLHADSVRIEKQFAEQEKWDKLFAMAQYPLIKEAKLGGIIAVKDATEIPDPNLEYKLLFELIQGNPDSTKNETDGSLSEVARVINLHVAAGIPAKKIIPVIVVHGNDLNAITNNAYYNKHFKMDNPNLKLIEELKNAGAKIIACGQAMVFFDINREDLLPFIKVSLTAQTVLSSYQLKGYVLKNVVLDK